jgi:hypothetical protein
MSSSDWLKHVKTRFKLGLKKPQISKAIEELRNLNRDFVLITEQITKALEEAVGEHRSVSGGTGHKQVKSLNVLQRYHRVRHASKALYSTVQVRWVCEAHRCHLFDVRILDFDPDSGKGKGEAKASIAQCVTCELAITHDGSSYASRAPLRLEVEQACEMADGSVGFQQGPEDAAAMRQLLPPSSKKTSADTRFQHPRLPSPINQRRRPAKLAVSLTFSANSAGRRSSNKPTSRYRWLSLRSSFPCPRTRSLGFRSTAVQEEVMRQGPVLQRWFRQISLPPKTFVRASTLPRQPVPC